MENNIEIPEYFICPISLDIMKDPVTAISGITYDRESIEKWLFKSTNTICPVSKQPLPRDWDLTPNHTLRRLIQAWSSLNQSDQIPTPKTPLTKLHVVNLIRDLPKSQTKTLQKLESLAAENDRNKVFMVEAGLIGALVSFIVSCHARRRTKGLKEALSLFYLLRSCLGKKSSGPLTENDEIIEAMIWVLGGESDFLLPNRTASSALPSDVGHVYKSHAQFILPDCTAFPVPPSDDCHVYKPHALYVLKVIIHRSNARMLERLSPEFLKTILSCLKEASTAGETNSILQILFDACPWGRNRVAMVESGAVFDLVEVELRSSSSPEKKRTELVMGILHHLCSCADGRAQLLGHTGGLAVVTRRLMRVSAVADDRALFVIWLISKYSGTNGVVQEMVRVGTVAKLCMVMQTDCRAYLKEKAKEILRMHSDVWKDYGTCIDVDILTRFTR